jgi:hypothetical protein
MFQMLHGRYENCISLRKMEQQGLHGSTHHEERKNILLYQIPLLYILHYVHKGFLVLRVLHSFVAITGNVSTIQVVKQSK